MRTITFALLAAVVVVSTAGMSSARAEDPAACHPRGMRVVAATPRAVVLLDRQASGGGRYLGCTYSRGRIVPIARGARPTDRRDFPLVSVVPRIAGNFVAVDQGEAHGNIIVRRTVRVVDLRTGRSASAFTARGQLLVTDLELKANGSVGWIWRESDVGPSVHKLENGIHRVLYQGPLALRSLALSGSTLYWDTGSGPMSARLD
jgi:hypothetical protein